MALMVHEASSSNLGKQYTVVVKNCIKEPNERFHMNVTSSTSCKQLYSLVSDKARYVVGTFELVLNSPASSDDNGMASSIAEKDDCDLNQFGFSAEFKNRVDIKEKAGVAVEFLCPAIPVENKDALSSKVPEPPPPPPPPLQSDNQALSSMATQRRNALSSSQEYMNDIANTANTSMSEQIKEMASSKLPKLVGLVNQAMTCYLNSLIQTLFMTPEFRNALYRWECDLHDDTSTSIPYQLQHLFLLLQTSNKQSVETTGLTRSFGWDSSEAWQQHDIQELCRVMFDALEKKFEGTDQAELIKHLYEGTMKDYVQCCECGHESARDDTFLDVPITIRPFGSTKTYKSVIEGLNAFVEPEVLEESNQYFCEKCGKKCDAKKGLKFTRFPYLLTLQLKRFDFDYSSMHRIKLNDRMAFPQVLNLNSFIDDTESQCSSGNSFCDEGEALHTVVDEDSSSHDSGHDYEHGSSTNTGGGSGDPFQCPPRSSSDDEDEERSSVDEGIGIESQHSSHKRRKSNSNSSWILTNEEEAVKQYLKDGPFVYELFSVMVHSGSAAGGHYYAYIKSFEDNQWYSFNDQIVSPITYLDIEKTYGGSPYSHSSSYYSSFSSSTNAYMLMYRQINPAKNSGFIQTNHLPPHILKLLLKQRQEEEERQIRLENERNKCSIRLFCRHPSVCVRSRNMTGETFDFHKDAMLGDALQKAHSFMNLDPNVVPLGQCRLVKYDHINDVLDRSFDLDTEDANCTLSQLLGGPRSTYLFDLLLETRETNEVFERYERGGVTIKVFVVDHRNMSFYNPILLRSVESHTVLQLKNLISKRVNFPFDRLLVAYEKYSGECRLLSDNKRTLKQEGFFKSGKVFVDALSDEEYAQLKQPLQIDFRFEDTFLWSVIDRIAHIIKLNITLPPEPAEDQYMTKPSENDFIPGPIRLSSDGRNVASSSNDEGVGSLGCVSKDGTSQNGDYTNGDSSSVAKSISPKTEETTPNPEPTPNEMNHFWKIPEKSEENASEVNVEEEEGVKINNSYDNYFWKIPEKGDENCSAFEVNEGEEMGSRKRNNSYDNGTSFLPDVVGLHDKLQEKLEGVALDRSPTSSLRCEDSGSSHSGQNSFITDVDFESEVEIETSDNEPSPMKHYTGKVGSEDSSLSTSCSTLDSTDTLCNTNETGKALNEGEYLSTVHTSGMPPDYHSLFGNGPASSKTASQSAETASKPTEGSSFKPVLNKYPGRAVSSNVNSDYNKALRYADITSNNESLSTSGKDVPRGISGTGDPSDSTFDAEKTAARRSCLPDNVVTSEPKKHVTSGNLDTHARSTLAESFVGSTADSASTLNCTAPDLPPPAYEDALATPSSDPDSGEVMDKLKPLHSDSNAQTNSNTSSHHASSHSQNSSAGPSADSGGSFHRERTISTSSIASDGWGATPELLQKHDYFRVISTSTSTSVSTSDNSESRATKSICVEIDKRMTLLGLKRHLALIIGTPTRRFCIYRQYAGGQETELSTPTDDFHLISDNSSFVVRFGRALRKDEYRCKLYRLFLDQEDTAKSFMSWILQRGVSVKESKKQLVNDIAEQCGIKTEVQNLRIRKKTWKSPGQIYLPDDVFGTDISLYGSLEFFVEFLNKPEVKTKRNDLVLLTRRWYPSKLTFSDFEETVVSEEEEDMISYLGYSLEHLTNRISEVSGIPHEHVRVAKARGIFPYRISVLYAESELEWLPSHSRSHPFHVAEDGGVVFFKDAREPLKECTEEEKIEIEKEEQKYDYSPSTSTNKYLPSSNLSSPIKPAYRREKALKIYTVDTTPSTKKNVDFKNAVDI